MKKADLSRLERLEALIAEKRKQETFLAKLQERRAGTPEHVFKRLEDEYLTKLMDAQVKAATEADTLSGGLEDDDEAVAEVQVRLAQLEEERVEMQLRAEVEDWDAKETQKKLTAMTATISMAEKERDARKSVAERTRTLLNEARGGPQAAAAAPIPEPRSAPTPARPTQSAMTSGPNFDELAFLNSVVGRTSTPSTPVIRDPKPAVQPNEIKEAVTETASVASPSVPASPAPPPPAAPPAPLPAQPSLDLEAPKPAVVLPPAPQTNPPSVTAAREQSSAPEPVSASAPVAQPAAVPAAAAAAPAADPDVEDIEEEPSILGRPTPRTSQAIKTLKCAECGSMNYPTEWYCERCGGELAAL